MRDTTVAARYAKGMFLFSEKRGETAAALADLKGLLDTIENAHAGRAAADHRTAAPGPLARCKDLKPGIRLTSRQIQVLELLLSGLDNQASARETGLALGSVKNCVSSIFLDFNVRSRPELLKLFS